MSYTTTTLFAVVLLFFWFLYLSFCVGYVVIHVSDGVMYWGDVLLAKIETAYINGTGRKIVWWDYWADYYAFLYHGGDIYITDWNLP